MNSYSIMRLCLVSAALSSFVLYAAITSVGADESESSEEGMVDQLKPVSSFSNIEDKTARSIELFREAARVIQSPRCLNCHPVDRIPTQGDGLKSHMPPIVADTEGNGPPGLACTTCHQADNVRTFGDTIESIPGHHPWALAPLVMGWQGKSLGEICQQIKDKKRNGNRTLAQIHEHVATDGLVGWAWHPGEGRKPAPGSQQQFGELIAAWIDTGAHCP